MNVNTEAKRILEKVRYIKPIIVDIEGIPRGLIIRKKNSIEKLMEGVCFDGSSIKGHAKIENSDLVAKIDLNTLKIASWECDEMAIALCEVEDVNGKPYLENPRMKLKEYVKHLAEKGINVKVGVELEYFLLKKENGRIFLNDNGEYFDLIDSTWEFQRKLIETLEDIGIKINKCHHEVAKGQYEISIKAADPLTLADNITVAKIIIKTLARKHGLTATFMPKPFPNMNGSGMHIHLSIYRNGVNLFYMDENEISKIGLHAIGGILKHAKGNSLIVSPTVNSYKRLAPGYEAPTKICWGYSNRSAMIRIPRPIKNETCRIEYRHPDPSANPYLAILTIIETMINGVEEKLKPGEPCQQNAYRINGKYETLPGSLEEALKEFSKDETVKKILGEETYLKIMELKKKEWNEYQEYLEKNSEIEEQNITKWELEKYLEKM
ncbi:MAG: glutamine synthetase family protein [archaeon GB-1845-036]|nr:glutamine synthetase family protein [Candidatus Culexmicrobium thermophilum]